MAWLQLVFEAPSDLAELLSDSLEGLGADAVTMRDAGDEPIFEQELGQAKLWSSTIISGLFEDAADTQVLISKLEDKIAPQPLPPCDIQFIPDEDWERAWLKDFKPTRFGRRLWVVPSVFDPPDTGAVNVILDPGLAFGTGTHPTTSMCLEWLDGHLKGGESVLDFGCGSGILAIAALKLGAHHASAIDIDPQAVTATKENADKNHVLNSIEVGLPGALANKRFDLVIANILANPLIELANVIGSFVKPGGSLILSGILDSQYEQVIAAYSEIFEFSQPTVQDQWVMLAARRRDQ